jgi:hypothetical protein
MDTNNIQLSTESSCRCTKSLKNNIDKLCAVITGIGIIILFAAWPFKDSITNVQKLIVTSVGVGLAGLGSLCISINNLFYACYGNQE